MAALWQRPYNYHHENTGMSYPLDNPEVLAVYSYLRGQALEYAKFYAQEKGKGGEFEELASELNRLSFRLNAIAAKIYDGDFSVEKSSEIAANT